MAGAAFATIPLAHGEPLAGLETFETTKAILSFRAGSGDLIGIQWKRPWLEIIADARLGENFRILLSKSEKEKAYFNSCDQVVRKIDKSPNRIVLHYGPLKNAREEVDVRVDYEIRDTRTQLQFSIRVKNATDRPLAEVLFGIIGGQQGIAQRLDTESLVTESFKNRAPRLFSQFKRTGEATGTRYDSAVFDYPSSMTMSWMDIYNRKAGVGYYYANQDPDTRVVALYTEMHPYTKTLGTKDNWPSAAELPKEEPLGLTMGWANFPYTSKGTFRGGPLALQVHEGDWRAGSRIYRAWFDQHFKMAKANWLNQEMAWQALTLSNSEDEILYRFKDLPRLAADAKKYGVTTIRVGGWNPGGTDRGYPNFTLDPRLGTREEFRKALADIRAIGMHVFLMGSVPEADTSTADFRTRGYRYVVQRRSEPGSTIAGWGEGTIGARDASGLATTIARRKTVVSPAHPEFREELIRHYLDRVADGAEELYFESLLFVSSLDFNPSARGAPDQSIWLGTRTLLQDLSKRARKLNPDIALFGNFPPDRLIPYLNLANHYLETRDAGSTALTYTFPEWTSGTFVTDPGDFDSANDGLRYGLVWHIAPRKWTASMDEPLMRPISRYLSELIRIRKQYADILFHSRFNDTLGATVVGDEDNVRYSVFEPMNPKNKARAAVVVNFGDRNETVDVTILGREGQEVKVSAPFEPDRTALLPAKLTLRPHTAAVVVSQP